MFRTNLCTEALSYAWNGGPPSVIATGPMSIRLNLEGGEASCGGHTISLTGRSQWNVEPSTVRECWWCPVLDIGQRRPGLPP